MARLLAVLLAVGVVSPAPTLAQAREAAPRGKDAPAAGAAAPAAPAAPSLSPAPSGSPSTPDLDPAVREIVRREVERAKEEMRDEMRAEIQGAQSAREFMDTAAAGERAKLDFLQLNGYLRVRGDLFDNLDLHRDPDPSGYYLWPRALTAPLQHGTQTTANMRFRLEPTLNVSEQVRVLAQIDMLDNIVLGSNPDASRGNFTLLNTTQVPPSDGVNSDRNSIVVKRAWAEVQTPVGLLSFGRMPSSWGLGILSHAGNGIDDDFGDSVDRLQFALTPLRTPIGALVLVPMYEIAATGVTAFAPGTGRGLGQPFDRDRSDDAKSIGIKVVRTDTEEERKRKLDRGEATLSFGAWYMYKSQAYEFPIYAGAPTPLTAGQPTDSSAASAGPGVKRDASAHVLDVWVKRQSRRFRIEAELAGIVGQISNASNDPTNPVGPVLLRQFGGALQADYKVLDGRLTLGGEVGFASGDGNSGFGNNPGRNASPLPGDIEGAQFHCDAPGTGGTCDRVLDVRNFRFNPAYRVDMILFRELLGGVTDAWYVKPTARYELIDGLAAQLSVIYSQAMFASSTPSTRHNPLGVEMDVGVSYRSDDGFIAWLNYGLLQPLDGFLYPPSTFSTRTLVMGHAIRTGLAVKF